MHAQRLVVALVGLPLLLAVLFLAPAWVFGVVVAAAAAGVQLEFYRLQSARVSPNEAHVAIALGLPVSLAAAWGHPGAVLGTFLAAMFGLFLHALVRPEAARSAAERVALQVLGLAYGPALLAHGTLALADTGELGGPGAVLIALAVAWGGDTAAFYVGRSVGRRKLFPAVSPKKTWEGAVAGVAGSLAAAALIRAWLLPDLPAGHLVALAALAAVVGQLGDLCESLLKRGVGVKDSGGILPGHGGLLDRLDSLLFVLPLVYYYLRLVEVAGD